jgi:prevent-host-death family protein
MKRDLANRSVGVRELKNRTSAVLRLVKTSGSVTVTDRSRSVAVIVSLSRGAEEETLREMVKAGRIAWAGGKPKGLRRPPTVRGAGVARAVTEDRR